MYPYEDATKLFATSAAIDGWYAGKTYYSSATADRKCVPTTTTPTVTASATYEVEAGKTLIATI